ncbi:MAG: pilus assembly protein N-terminal domain-containing protein [Alphaproteobacteria bacterium]|nr:pilus assembly protein N-terminal domain-containing protein [Alphaproteobacteria bacterium]
MKKRLSVLCMAFLGLVDIPSVLAEENVKHFGDSAAIGEESAKKTDAGVGSKSSNGIMKEVFVRSVKNQKEEEARDDAIRAIKTEKEIEINSVNFLKFKKKIGEIFIPNSDIADVEMLSDKSLYLSGMAPGVTSLVIHDKDGKVLADYVVRVTYPLRDIKGAIAKIFPDLELDLVSIDNNLILKGSVASPEMAQDVLDIVGRFVDQGKIINKMSIETATQVMLKVKVAEVTRDVTKSLGINWRALSASGPSAGLVGVATGNTSGLPEFSSDAAADVLDNVLNADMQGGGKWIVSAGINNLSALIDALASESFATILAEPTLVALSGQEAKIDSGGEQGYVIYENNTSSTKFKDWGTAVTFTPKVLSEDRINIKVSSKVSSISGQNPDGSPNTVKKEVNTVVELGSGQSFAIAGILQVNRSIKTTETPFLADLPLIGSLFRSSNVSSVERELVIIVTPYIVKPSSKKLKAPSDMVPKMLSPLKSIINRRFHQLGQEADSAGFSLK